ncbi:hypothetical protein [Infirmifilum sp.]|uniref:hypothetical protein n=1 Tax=Infirmifilum sp. TaxID=2856575 RepID=UPI003D0E5EA3
MGCEHVREYNNYVGRSPFGGKIIRVCIPDPNNRYLSKEVYVEIREMGGYPYIAGVYHRLPYQDWRMLNDPVAELARSIRKRNWLGVFDI